MAHFLCTTDRFTSRLLFKKKCFNLFFRIFINMDDNIIEHYTNQSAFLIEMSEVVGGQFQVTLIEVWEPASSQPAPLKDVTNYSCQLKQSLIALLSQRLCKLWTAETNKRTGLKRPQVFSNFSWKWKLFLCVVNTTRPMILLFEFNIVT